jgi:hypothetical protein
LSWASPSSGQFVRDVLAADAAVVVGADHLFRFQQLRGGRSTG